MITDIKVKEEETKELAPREVLRGAEEKAKVLSELIEKQKVYVEINGRKFVKCEGWTTLATLAGVIPSIEDVNVEIQKDDTGKQIVSATATAVLRNKQGQIISKGVALCSSKEKKWRDKDTYAILSMAQTRAISKVCRLALSWIMILAGFEATPAEEITEEIKENDDNSKQQPTQPQSPPQPQQQQQQKFSEDPRQPELAKPAQIQAIRMLLKRCKNLPSTTSIAIEAKLDPAYKLQYAEAANIIKELNEYIKK